MEISVEHTSTTGEDFRLGHDAFIVKARGPGLEVSVYASFPAEVLADVVAAQKFLATVHGALAAVQAAAYELDKVSR